MKKLYWALAIGFLAYFAFITTALAGTAMSPDDGALLDLARPMYDAIVHGQWWIAAASGLMFAVALFKRYAPGKAGEWAKGDVGGPIMVLLFSYGAAVLTGLLALGPSGMMSATLAWAAFKVALSAAGGYTFIKKLVAPVLRKLADKSPAWLASILNILLWAFEQKTPVEVAEQAGRDAAAANPPQGADSVVSKPVEL